VDALIAKVRDGAAALDQRIEPAAAAADLDAAERRYYWQTSPSLAECVQEWAESDGRWRDLSVDVIGWETRKDPFTGLPREYAITRPRGPMLDLSDRT